MHGLIVLDKPAGVTSHDALDPVKKRAGRGVRVGHAGTLDPFATGVLLALVGDATRLADLALRLPKTYEATVRFGVATDTLDPEGEVVERADPGAVAPADLEAALAKFAGEIEQVPPAHSALKVGGRRAYRLAREGKPVELPPRRVTVHAIGLRSVAWPEAVLRIECGSGTYVRSIARDLGAALSLPAHLTALRRTAIGPFSADDAGDSLLPPLAVVRAAGLPEVSIPLEDARRFVAGAPVPAAVADGLVAVLRDDVPALLGLARAERGRLRPAKVLSGPQAELRGGGA